MAHPDPDIHCMATHNGAACTFVARQADGRTPSSMLATHLNNTHSADERRSLSQDTLRGHALKRCDMCIRVYQRVPASGDTRSHDCGGAAAAQTPATARPAKRARPATPNTSPAQATQPGTHGAAPNAAFPATQEILQQALDAAAAPAAQQGGNDPQQAPATHPAPVVPDSVPNHKRWAEVVAEVLSFYARASEARDRELMAEALVLLGRCSRQKIYTQPKRDAENKHPDLPAAAAPHDDTLHADFANIARAVKLLRARNIGKALNAIVSNGLVDINVPAVQDKLSSLYPAHPPIPGDKQLLVAEDCIPVASEDAIARIIANKDPTTGAGASGHSYADLQLLRRNHPTLWPEVLKGLTALVNDICRGRLAGDDALRPAVTVMRGIALRKKPGSDDPRPIGIGELPLQIAGAYLYHHSLTQTKIADAVGRFQLGVGAKGGIETASHLVNAALYTNPDWVAIDTDASGAFQNVSPSLLLAVTDTFPHLAGYVATRYAHHADVNFTQRNPPGTFSLRRTGGIDQGDHFGNLFYSTLIRKVHDKLHQAFPNLVYASIIDGLVIVGPKDEAFAALKLYASLLETDIGNKLNPAKTSVFTRAPSPACDQVAALATAAGLPAPSAGFVLGGVPIGTDQYIHDRVAATCANVTNTLRRLLQCVHADDTRAHAIHQDVYHVIRLAITSTTNHLARGVAPPLIEPLLDKLDRDVALAILDIVYPRNLRDETYFTVGDGPAILELIQAPARMGGLGIRSMADATDEAYVGSLALSAPLILERALLGPSFNPDTHGAAALPHLQGAIDRLRAIIKPEADPAAQAAGNAPGAAAVPATAPGAADQPQLPPPAAPVAGAHVGAAANTAAASPGDDGDDDDARAVDPSPSLLQLNPTNVWSSAYPKAQHFLGKARNTSQYASLADKQRTRTMRVMTRSRASPHSAAWLTSLSQRLTNNEFDAAIQLLLGLDILPPTADASLRCPGCGEAGCLTPDAAHAFGCKHISGRNASNLHAQVKKQVTAALRGAYRPDAKVNVPPAEPKMNNYFPRVGNGHDDVRADIGVFSSVTGKPILIIDVKTVSPISANYPNADKRQGAAAQRVYDQTLQHYTSQYPDSASVLLPFVIERGGFIHPQSWRILKQHIKRGYTTFKPKPDGGLQAVVDTAGFNDCLQRLLESMQTSVQRANAWVVSALAQRVRDSLSANTVHGPNGA